MNTYVRWTNLVFHYFFVTRIVIALFAGSSGFGWSTWVGGPTTWMLVYWMYIYLPVCLVFVAYNVFLFFKKQYRRRLNTINWVLFIVALAAEVWYLRLDLG